MTEGEPTGPVVDEAVLDRVSDGILTLDGEFRVAYLNDRGVEVLGRPRAEILGNEIWTAIPEIVGTKAETALREVMTESVERSFERYNEELGRWFDVRIYPEADGLTIYLSDVTDRTDYQQDLARKDRQLRTLVENTNEAVYIKNREGRYELMNDAGARLFDREADEIVGLTDEELFDDASADAIRERDKEILSTGRSDSREAVRSIDGEEHVFIDNKYPYRDESGEIQGIMGISHDITERHAYETRLRTIQESIRQLNTARTQEGIAQLALEATVSILELPIAAVWLYDEDRDALVPVAESDGARELVGPAPTFGPGDGIAWTVFESGEHVTIENVAAEPGVYNPDTALGAEVIVPLGETGVITTSATEPGAFSDADVELFRILAAATREALVRADREAEFRALSEEYEAVLENAEDAIFLVDVEWDGEDPTFRFERLNPAHEAITGMRTEAVRGKTPRDALGPDEGAAVAANYRRCVKAGEPIQYEEVLDMPEGEFTWQTSLTPVFVDGKVSRIVGIARDLTERVEREQALRRKNERLDEFARVISHDLRNPLNVAQGRLALLADQSESEHLPPIRDSLDRMAAIVEDTLTLAREGSEVGETEPVGITDLAGQCWGMVETGDASLDVADAFSVPGDRDRLRHVFENLFRNAVEHGSTSPPSHTREDAVEHGSADAAVRVERLEDGFAVEDDGTGIPAEARETVFEPGETTAEGGTGFGLAIVKRIVEAHGWQVAIAESEAGGARFEVTGVDVVD